MVDPVGKDALVADGLLARVEAVAISLDLPVAMPDQQFEAADYPEGFLAVAYLPNTPKWEGLSAGAIMDQGLLGLSLMLPKQRGLIPALNLVAAIKAAFPSGLALWHGGHKIKIDRAPWTASPLMGDPFTNYPMTISWEAA